VTSFGEFLSIICCRNLLYDTTRQINVRSKADEMASLI